MTLLKSYWHLLTIVLLFMTVQLVAFALALRWMRSARLLIQQVREHPLSAVTRSTASNILPWLCLTDARVGESGLTPTATRESIDELEEEIESKWSFAILHRTSVLAPLLGVMITSAEFLRLGLRQSDSQQIELAGMVLPLILGVGAGAFLASINQVLLLLVERRKTHLFSTARIWMQRFEHTFRESSRTDEIRFGDLADALRQHAGVMRQHGTQVEKATQPLENATQSLIEAGRSLLQVVEEIPRRLQNVNEVMDNSTSALKESMQTMGDLVDGMNRAVAKFDNCVTQNMIPVAERQEGVTRGLNQFADDASNLRELLVTAAGNVHSVVAGLTETSHLTRAIFTEHGDAHRDRLAALDEQHRTTMSAMSDLSTELKKSVALIAKKVELGDQVFQELGDAAQRFQKSVDEDCQPAFASYKSLVESYDDVAIHAANSTRELGRITLQLRETVEIQREVADELRDSIRENAIPANVALGRAAHDLDEGSHYVAESVEKFRSLLENLALETRGIRPALDTLVASLNPSGLDLGETIEQHLKPAIKTQGSLLGRQSEAIVQVTDRLRKLEMTIAASLQQATHMRDSAGDVRDSTRELTSTIADLKNVVNMGFAPAQQQFADAVKGLTQSMVGLQMLLNEGAQPLKKEIGELNEAVSRVAALMQSLSEISQSAQLTDDIPLLLAHLTRLSSALGDLPQKVGESISDAMAKATNGRQRNPIFFWIR